MPTDDKINEVLDLKQEEKDLVRDGGDQCETDDATTKSDSFDMMME